RLRSSFSSSSTEVKLDRENGQQNPAMVACLSAGKHTENRNSSEELLKHSGSLDFRHRSQN
ncbi:10363_t:CDS:2, partial [Acaulospora colombiana]